MTNQSDRGVNTKIKRVFNTTASVLITIALFILIWFGMGNCVYADAADNTTKCAISFGESNVVYVDSYEEGQKVIKKLRKHYIGKNSKIIDVTFTPEITLEKVSSQPVSLDDDCDTQEIVTVSVNTAVKKILSAKRVKRISYETKDGETLKSIAEDKNLSVKRIVTLNNNKYDSDTKLKVGTKIYIYKKVPCVSVKTVERTTTKKTVRFKTVYKNTSTLSRGETKVKRKGVKGTRTIVSKVTKVNGKKVSKKVISNRITKKPVTKIVLRGTANVTPKKGKTFDFATGADVIKYAKKFVGNPYRYGGTSLTKGCDCSGFVYSVYRHKGVNMPRCGQENVGKTVSVNALKKGDILFYYGHVAMYAGNGKAIHAVNERLGIKITSLNYTGRVQKARRIFE